MNRIPLLSAVLAFAEGLYGQYGNSTLTEALSIQHLSNDVKFTVPVRCTPTRHK
jgi:hypothetical protein